MTIIVASLGILTVISLLSALVVSIEYYKMKNEAQATNERQADEFCKLESEMNYVKSENKNLVDKVLKLSKSNDSNEELVLKFQKRVRKIIATLNERRIIEDEQLGRNQKLLWCVNNKIRFICEYTVPITYNNSCNKRMAVYDGKNVIEYVRHFNTDVVLYSVPNSYRDQLVQSFEMPSVFLNYLTTIGVEKLDLLEVSEKNSISTAMY